MVGASGPSNVRTRTPWPTITNGAPTGRLAVPQPAHVAGLAAEQDGGFSAQDLTSISK